MAEENPGSAAAAGRSVMVGFSSRISKMRSVPACACWMSELVCEKFLSGWYMENAAVRKATKEPDVQTPLMTSLPPYHRMKETASEPINSMMGLERASTRMNCCCV